MANTRKKKVYFIKEDDGRYNFAHVYNAHIIASTRQGYSRKGDCEKVYDNNFIAGAERDYVTRADFKKLFAKKKKK